MLTVDLCFSVVSLGNNNFGPPVKDKGFFLLSLCFTKRGEDRVVLSFPPKWTLVERGLPSCLQKGLPRQSLFSSLWFQRCNKIEELGRYVRGFFIDQLPKFVVRVLCRRVLK